MHSVEAVKIEADKVHVICSCGWKSKKVADETTARELHIKHAERD